MGATTGGSVQKAWFQSDDTGAWFEVQYNPVNFKFDKPVSWKEHDDQGKEGSLEFQKASPASMSCELTFDTTHDGSDVRTSWVNKLLKLTNPEVSPSKGEAASLEKKRPHKVWFVWGQFALLGVIESVNATYIMFAQDGSPLRAKVTVKMKEWNPEDYEDGSGGSSYDTQAVKLVTVGSGDTVTSIAMANNAQWRDICDDNGIDDPVDGVQAGDQVAVKQSK
jgi:hypothetical protein